MEIRNNLQCQRNIKILFVDDDLTSSEYFKASFSDKVQYLNRTIRRRRLVYFAETRKYSFDLDRSQNATDDWNFFLTKSMKYSPDSTRILISGRSENELVIRAINEGHIRSH